MSPEPGGQSLAPRTGQPGGVGELLKLLLPDTASCFAQGALGMRGSPQGAGDGPGRWEAPVSSCWCQSKPGLLEACNDRWDAGTGQWVGTRQMWL